MSDERPQDPTADARPRWERLLRSDVEPDTEAERLIRERIERGGAAIVQRHLGVPIGEDGKPDVDGVSEEDLQKALPELATDLFESHLGVLEWAAGERDAPPYLDGDEETGLPDLAELLSDDDREALGQFAQDVRLVLAFLGGRPDHAEEDVERLASRLQGVIFKGLEEAFKTPLFKDGKLDFAYVDRAAALRLLGDRLLGVLMSFGQQLDQARERLGTPSPYVPPKSTTAGILTGEHDLPRVGGTDDDPESADEEPENVIFLAEVRKRLKAKREQMASTFGDGLGETLAKLIEQQSGGPKGGSIVLDNEFFKEHGSTLVKELVQSLSRAFVPKKVEVTLPMADDEPAAGTGAESSEEPPARESGDGSGVKVSVNLDLANILNKFFGSGSSDPSDDSSSGH